jgi:transposase
LVGRLELSPFYEKVKAVEGHAGQPPFDPRLMISVWVYGLSRGISSARELSEWCDWEPGLQWLCGLESVNYHSLSTFRAAHGEALKKLFIEVLGVLSAEGLVSLERVTVDGTRIRAHCSNEGFRQGQRLQEHLDQAAAHVEALEQEPEETISRRQQAARERSRRERQERVAAARQFLEQLRQERGEGKAAQVQISVSEVEARIMKQPGGGFGPSYNLQLATDDKEKIIVAAVVSDSGTDVHLLADVMDEVKGTCGELPDKVLVDGGYVSADNLDQSQQRNVELIGPAPDMTTMVNKQAQQRGVSEAYFKQAFTYQAASDTYLCPEGRILIHIKQRSREGGRIEHEYRAKHSDTPHVRSVVRPLRPADEPWCVANPTPCSKRFARRCRRKPIGRAIANDPRWLSSQMRGSKRNSECAVSACEASPRSQWRASGRSSLITCNSGYASDGDSNWQRPEKAPPGVSARWTLAAIPFGFASLRFARTK